MAIDFGNEPMTGIDGYIAEAKEHQSKFTAGKKYSDNLSYNGPTRFVVTAITPATNDNGGLFAEIRATVNDAYLPPSEQGKLLIAKVPYGKELMSNGKPRDTFMAQVLESSGFTHEELVAFKTVGRTKAFTSLIGRFIHGNVHRNDRVYSEVGRWNTPTQYELGVASGGQQIAPVPPTKNGAVTGTVTAPPTVTDVPAGM